MTGTFMLFRHAHFAEGIARLFIALAGTARIFAAEASTGHDLDQCAALAQVDFSKVEDAATQVISATSVAPNGDAPGYCEVRGYVAQNFAFVTQLPDADHWNGKFLEQGCTGSCGAVGEESATTWCADPLRRGYACILSNGGNQSSGHDWKWGYNNPQSMLDLYARAPHVTALAGKAIVASYYGKQPTKSYFRGCSCGGLQAMWMAQKFPWDFDGIIAGAAEFIQAEGWLANMLWAWRVNTDTDGQPILKESDLEFLHQAVVSKCDMNDGVKDGLIGDPRLCQFQAAELRCKSGSSGHCLTDTQVEVVDRIYQGAVNSKGAPVAHSSAMKGSELSWGILVSKEGNYRTYAPDHFRYYYFQPNPGPNWDPNDFDFEKDYKRLGLGEIAEPTNPDLRRLKEAGAKLLLYSGWNDWSEVSNSIDYYETAERIIGGRKATQDFFRLFVVPGMWHCGLPEKKDAPYTLIDYLSYLESWVEKGQAPDQLLSFNVASGDPEEVLAPPLRIDPKRVRYTRPVYPYPVRAQYLGRGDPNDASNFGPRVDNVPRRQ